MAFFPAERAVPVTLRTPKFVLRQLCVAVAELDYAAYTSSPDVIRDHSGGLWPVAGYTLDDERRELAQHEERHAANQDFAFILLTPDGSAGCTGWPGATAAGGVPQPTSAPGSQRPTRIRQRPSSPQRLVGRPPRSARHRPADGCSRPHSLTRSPAKATRRRCRRSWLSCWRARPTRSAARPWKRCRSSSPRCGQTHKASKWSCAGSVQGAAPEVFVVG